MCLKRRVLAAPRRVLAAPRAYSGSTDLVLVEGGLGTRAEACEEAGVGEVAEVAHEARAKPEDDAANVALGVELRDGHDGRAWEWGQYMCARAFC